MSKQFNVTTIKVLQAPADVPGHDNKWYVNSDFQTGRVFCEDESGDMFYQVFPKLAGDDERRIWPKPNANGTITLFRDYWRYAGFNANDDPTALAPYFRSLAEAEYEVVA